MRLLICVCVYIQEAAGGDLVAWDNSDLPNRMASVMDGCGEICVRKFVNGGVRIRRRRRRGRKMGRWIDGEEDEEEYREEDEKEDEEEEDEKTQEKNKGGGGGV